MLFITRKEHFNAAHKLYNPQWSEEKNAEIFGKCSNPNWHGHNYNLYVTVKGNINPETGFVVNLKDLSTIIRVEVCDKLDHKNLNLDVDFLKGVMTSTENVTIAIFNILTPKIKQLGAELHSIKLYETENNYVEYFGN
ncbi:MAG: 6-carboxytetrahydropterin synthase [Bacteroidia bacterium]